MSPENQNKKYLEQTQDDELSANLKASILIPIAFIPLLYLVLYLLSPDNIIFKTISISILLVASTIFIESVRRAVVKIFHRKK